MDHSSLLLFVALFLSVGDFSVQYSFDVDVVWSAFITSWVCGIDSYFTGERSSRRWRTIKRTYRKLFLICLRRFWDFEMLSVSKNSQKVTNASVSNSDTQWSSRLLEAADDKLWMLELGKICCCCRNSRPLVTSGCDCRGYGRWTPTWWWQLKKIRDTLTRLLPTGSVLTSRQCCFERCHATLKQDSNW